MKVAVYARVSSSEQTTENQLLPLREHCERMAYEIVKEYVDNGWSGKDNKRPQLENLIRDMRSKKFDCVMVMKIDRVGRSLQHLLSFLQELRNKKVNFVSLSESIDTSTSHGELIWSILGAFAQYERKIIIERTKAGLKRVKSEGKCLGRPFGSKDKKRRRRSGYYRRWAGERSK